MELMLDTYSNPSKLSRFLSGLKIGCWLCIVIGFFGMPVSNYFIAISLFPFFVLMVISLLKSVPSDLLMYEKDGDLILSATRITLNNVEYELKSIYKIDITTRGNRGNPTGDRTIMGNEGTANSIKIYTTLKSIIEKKFVLNTRKELDDFKELLMRMKENGVNVKVDKFDLNRNSERFQEY
jgi:hypothetical protein